MVKHWESHPEPVPDCFGCRAPTGMLLSDEYRRITKSEAKLSRDLAAYKRLRGNGLQPKDYRDCERLEATGDKAKIENAVTRLDTAMRQTGLAE